MRRFCKQVTKLESPITGARSTLYQIVIPVFNEQLILDVMLGHAKNNGYLKDLVIVNDASTDNTYDILEKWRVSDGLTVFHLTQNKKKEGAVKEVLFWLKQSGNLNTFTILLDADTYLDPSESGNKIEKDINDAVAYLQSNDLYGLALRLNAVYLKSPSIFWMSAYTTYIGIQFDNWLLSKQKQLWVINGAAGIFRSETLMDIFERMEFNFETGDLQITVELMKEKKKIEYYKKLLANSYVPLTFKQFFNQRRRWERGTTKVLWQDKDFYISQLIPPKFLTLALLIHLSIYISFWVALLVGISDGYRWNWTIDIFLYSYVGWVLFDLVKGYYVIYKEKYNTFGLYFLCEIANSLVTIFVITPARLYGGYEAVKYLMKKNLENLFKRS